MEKRLQIALEWFVVFAFAIASVYSFAQEQKDTTKNNHASNLEEMVITAQYAPTLAEKAVQAIRVIDSKKIRTMGAQNLRDVLTNELNIRITQDNVLGSGMSLQGISGQNIKLLVDGVPLTGRLNGNIDLSQINMINVERIEIIEGPLSVNYGTDALGGTINIITNNKQSAPITCSSTNYYESQGNYNFSAKLGLKYKRESLTFNASRYYFDGWNPTDKAFLYERKELADSNRFEQWKPKTNHTLTGSYTHDFNKLKLGFTSDYFIETVINRGAPRLPYFETAFDDYYHTNRTKQAINLTGDIGKNLYLQLLAAYTQFKRVKNTYFKDLTTLEQDLTTNPSDQDTASFKNFVSRGSISTKNRARKINGEVGYDFNYEIGTGARIENLKQDIGDIALFASAEYEVLPALTIRPGVRASYNTDYKAPVVPSLHIKYAFGGKRDTNNINGNQSKQFTLRLSYARGFRSPSLKELYFYFVDINHNITGNPDLKAETSNNFNGSLRFTPKTKKQVLSFELAAFYNRINQLISLAQATSTTYSYFNIDNYQTVGAQINSDFSIHKVKITAGIAHVGRYNQLSETTDATTFSFSPEVRFNVVYDWVKPAVSFGLFYKYTGKTPGYNVDASGNLYQTMIQDYHTADLSLQKQFFKKRLQVGFGIKNLMNVRNINGVSTSSVHGNTTSTISVGTGRTYFFKIDFQLSYKK